MRIARVILIPLTICAISCRGEPPLRPTSDRMVVGIETGPANLDPRFATDAYSSRLCDIIYSSLVKRDADAEFTGDLATSWEQAEPTRYVFHLRDDVPTHDGGKLSSADVCYTFGLVMAPDSTSPFKGDFEVVKNVSCPDPAIVILELKEPSAPLITSLTIGIIPKSANLADLPSKPVGSGPYIMKEFRAGEYVRLERFDRYFGEKPAIRELVFRIIPNAITRVLEMESGGLDLLQNTIQPENYDMFSKRPGVKFQSSPGINYNYIGFNLEDPILKDRRVREAIALSVDRDALIKYLWRGAAKPATGLLSPRNWAYNPNVETYPFDPEKAKKLLDDAGLRDPDGDGPAPRLRLTLKTSTDRLRRRIAEVIRTQLSAVGIELDVRSYEFGTFYKDIVNGNFQLFTLSWVGITEPDIYRFVFHSTNIPPKGANRGRYSNPEIDRLTEDGRRETDPAKRKAIYAEVQAILAHDLPYVSLYYTDDVAVTTDRVENFKINPGGDFESLLRARLTR